MRVTVRRGNVNKALSVFSKKCKPIVREVAERQEYEKPTTKRKRKRRLAVARERKRQQETEKAQY